MGRPIHHRPPTPRRRWPGPRAAVLAFCLGLLLGATFATHAARVAALSLAVLPSAVAMLPLDPLTYLTPPPARETVSFPYSVGQVDADIYAPGTPGRYGAVILILGARPVDRDDPTLVRFAEGLSRAGLVVMIPASSQLAAGRILPEEVDAVVGEVDLLEARPDVDPARIGIFGFSVGGSVAVQAAADPRLDGRLVLVNAFGSYDDSRNLIRAVSTRSLAYAGVDEEWIPNPLTLWVLARQLVDTLPDEHDRDILDRIYLQEDAAARDDVEAMTPVGRAALGLLDGLSPPEAERALALMSPATIERLRGISPSLVLGRVHTRLFLMHDRGDRFIPYTESRIMAEQAPAGVVARYAEFDLFDHVMPDRAPTSPTFYIEVARLFGQLYGVLLYLL
ncbi:MAG: dienelactone hydrolase family protein [Chloroflexi bacterium]|nr:dienelactone hydrolase family protein [Chloroflexota bacterium]